MRENWYYPGIRAVIVLPTRSREIARTWVQYYNFLQWLAIRTFQDRKLTIKCCRSARLSRTSKFVVLNPGLCSGRLVVQGIFISENKLLYRLPFSGLYSWKTLPTNFSSTVFGALVSRVSCMYSSLYFFPHSLQNSMPEFVTSSTWSTGRACKQFLGVVTSAAAFKNRDRSSSFWWNASHGCTKKQIRLDKRRC